MTSDPAGPPDLRAVGARLPAGVAVLAVRWRGGLHAGTVSAVTVLSLDPPLIGVALHADSRLREALDDVATWTLSALADEQAAVADWLASPGRPTVGQLDRVPTGPTPSGAVRIEGAAAWLDARTREIVAVGDHDLVVGDVLVAEQGPPGAGGLVHLRGRLVPVRSGSSR